MFTRQVAQQRAMVLLMLSSVCSKCVYAAEPAQQLVSPLATLGRLAGALIIVLIVFWVFARVMRQMQGMHHGLHQDLKVIASLGVGQRERVLVVQAGDQQLVLGVTSTQINTLHVLDKPLNSGHQNHNASGDFRQKLSSALKRQAPPS